MYCEKHYANKLELNLNEFNKNATHSHVVLALKSQAHFYGMFSKAFMVVGAVWVPQLNTGRYIGLVLCGGLKVPSGGITQHKRKKYELFYKNHSFYVNIS